MLLPRRVRKMIAVFRGEIAPALIVLSVALGFWFGVTPGWYGIHVILLALALVLNVHIGLFLMWAAFGKAFCYGLAPVMYHAGAWTHEHAAFALNAFASLPILGLTDYSRYAVAGAVLIGPILGLIFGGLLARAVFGFRKTYLAYYDNSEALRKWRDNRWIALLDRVLIGKRAVDVRATLERKPRYIRWPGVILAVVLAGIFGCGLYFVQGDRLADSVTTALTRLNGAEVSVEKFDLSPWKGRLTAKGLQAADPEQIELNRLAVEELTADADLWELACGRLVLERVKLGAVKLNQPRSRPAVPLTTDAPSPAAEEPGFDPRRFELSAEDIRELQTYLADAKKMQDRFRALRKWLPPAVETEPPPPPEPVPAHYLEYVTARAVLPPRPRLLVREAEFADVTIPIAAWGTGTVYCTNLSDAPAAATLPLGIEIKSRENANELRILRRYDLPTPDTEISGTFDQIDLRRLQDELNPGNPVVFEAGTVAGEFVGVMNRDYVDIALAVRISGMRARPNAPVFGLDREVTSEIFEVLENLETTLRLVGPTTRPRLYFDAPELTREFQRGLLKAGKTQLARRLDAVIADKLPEGAPKVDEILADPTAAVGDTVSSLLQKKEADKKKEQERKEEEKQNRRQALEQLRERMKERQKAKEDDKG